MSEEMSSWKNNYKCDICNRTFWSLYCIKNHVKIHISDKIYRCDVCFKQFVCSASLDRHWRNRHEKNRKKERKAIRQCRICSQTFSREDKLKEHYLEHDIKRPYHCSICGVEFSFITNLRRHEKGHKTGPEKPGHQCDVCCKILSSSYNLKVHLRIHTGEKPFSCKVCFRRFGDRSDYRRHQLSHESVDTGNQLSHKSIDTRSNDRYRYKCSFCGKCCRHPYRLKEHIANVHTGVKQHVCNVCGKAFYLRYELMRHQRIHTGDGLIKCDICDATFNRTYTLNRHMQRHSGKREYHLCNICGKKFTRYFTLQRHMTIHNGTEPFLCGMCGRKFVFKSELNVHMKVACCNEQKRYQCHICNKVFTAKRRLDCHLKDTHEFDSAYFQPNTDQTEIKDTRKWQYCEISNKVSLHEHKHQHTKERPFPCPVCHKSFKLLAGRDVHLKIHTGDSCHYCTDCERYFTRPVDLERHLCTENHLRIASKNIS